LSALVFYLLEPFESIFFKKQLLGRTEQFMQCLRWRVFHHLNPDVAVRFKETYGFKTYRTAPQSQELADFEKDLANLVSNVKFTKYRTPFQQQLRKDVCDIKRSDSLLIQADKTTNIYKTQSDNGIRIRSLGVPP